MSFDRMMTDRITIIKPDHRRFPELRCSFQGSQVIIIDKDDQLPLEEGDTIVHHQRNALRPEYVVTDRGYTGGVGGIPSHYCAKVKRKVTKDEDAGQSANPPAINVSGTHARVNVNSVDQSINISNPSLPELFLAIRDAVKDQVQDATERAAILNRLDDLEASHGTRDFRERYDRFVAELANHATILNPCRR